MALVARLEAQRQLERALLMAQHTLGVAEIPGTELAGAAQVALHWVRDTTEAVVVEPDGAAMEGLVQLPVAEAVAEAQGAQGVADLEPMGVVLVVGRAVQPIAMVLESLVIHWLRRIAIRY